MSHRFISGAVFAGALCLALWPARTGAAPGATVPWTRYEAETMAFGGGFIQGPNYSYNNVVAESSGRRCVRLNSTGGFVRFTSTVAANAVVVRYSVPDAPGGGGADYTLSLYRNGSLVGKLPVTSKYSWLYGPYPFVNTPGSGSARNFYDEVSMRDIAITPGDVLELRKETSDTAPFYDIDFVELEDVPEPLDQPEGSLSITAYGATGNGTTDDTDAFTSCMAAAASQGKSVWIPPGNYKLTRTISIPSNMTIRGAGMWHSKLVGDHSLYTNSSRRVSLQGNGNNIHLSDFAIFGKLTYRNDSEPNDGIGGSFGTGSSISRIWVEHTKTGAWIVNSQGLVVEDCRFRNTIADGINVCVGMQGTVVTNCTARGTGDDGFAIWPASYRSATYPPGQNVIRNCTAETPFLANGAAIYGGSDNRIEDSVFRDTTYGCGVLISTTFDVSHPFGGTTAVERSDLVRCGGYDPGFTWRAALQFCLQRSGISGVAITDLAISNSISDGVSVIYGAGGLSNATMANVKIGSFGLGATGRQALWARSDAVGRLVVSNSLVPAYRNDSPNFSFTFLTSTVPVKVQSNPPGRAFKVDGITFTNAQNFDWSYGSTHNLAVDSPQSGGDGVQYVWTSWSDGGAASHSIVATDQPIYTADFGTRYFLSMNPGPGGSVSPASGWQNSGMVVPVSATASEGYVFDAWAGSGSGSYSGPDSTAVVTMNGPITQAAGFRPAKQISVTSHLDFGPVLAGSSRSKALVIANAGETALTVSDITEPEGFTAGWSGTLHPGQSTNVLVAFHPGSPGSYGGVLTVVSDATAGLNETVLSGAGVVEFPAAFNRLDSPGLTGENDLILTYRGYPDSWYALEKASDPAAPAWNSILTNRSDSAGLAVFTNSLQGAVSLFRVREIDSM
jgi:hypothetical protein